MADNDNTSWWDRFIPDLNPLKWFGLDDDYDQIKGIFNLSSNGIDNESSPTQSNDSDGGSGLNSIIGGIAGAVIGFIASYVLRPISKILPGPMKAVVDLASNKMIAMAIGGAVGAAITGSDKQQAPTAPAQTEVPPISQHFEASSINYVAQETGFDKAKIENISDEFMKQIQDITDRSDIDSDFIQEFSASVAGKVGIAEEQVSEITHQLKSFVPF